MTPIPNGTPVRFFRAEHDENHYAAVIKSSHRLAYQDGFHYEIVCDTFPFIIGFAHDDELFTDVAQADLAARKVQVENRKKLRSTLLSKIADLNAQVNAIALA